MLGLIPRHTGSRPPSRRGRWRPFILLLGTLPFLAAALNSPTLGLASVFYRTGALVFGGGHVVLPMLQSEVVGRGWLDLDDFLGGYGAAQALPAPCSASRASWARPSWWWPPAAGAAAWWR